MAPSQPRDAGWAVVVLGRLSSGRLRRIGESYDDVPLSNVRADYSGCPRPTAAMGELTALFWALASSCSVTTRLHIDFSDSEYATGVVEGRTRAQHPTGLVHHVRAHSGVAGNEVADVLANTGRIRGPAPVQKVSPQCFHDSARGSKPPRRTIQLDVSKQIREVGAICEGYAMWISAATPNGSGGTELMHGRSFLSATRPDLWSRAGSVVTFSTFCVLHVPSAHPPPRAEEWWDNTGSILRTVFRPTRDRVVMIEANGRLGEAPTPLRTSTTTAAPDELSMIILRYDVAF